MKLKRKFVVFLLGALFFFSMHLKAQIVEMHHFNEINAYVDSETLIILDIDDTLLIPVQMLGCDEWFKYRLQKHRNEGMQHSIALEKTLAEWEAVRHLTRMEIVESGTDRIVNALQKRGFCVIGLTTQGVALATRTRQQLKMQGFDFSANGVSEEDYYFLLEGEGMLFRRGILFTCGKSKGKALFNLLEKSTFYPKRILFVNDKIEHLADVEEEAEKHSIEFLGLRYSYSDTRKAAFRPEIAEMQFEYSTFNHLLSDEEAYSFFFE